ncbi:hypothetical protein [Lentilitoribacter sp. Alg239-R112]|jgi:hypothetical protein|uniref:hypothetical protein n=1 Tax=Lentilitoribacter sp. Alg239-R112 TaxID=2305987 RepID=UPI0013A6EBA2|nr:hypothetical protein [Lentilitoribacter sp. Alg239-R112]
MANEELWTSSGDDVFETKSSGTSALRISVLFACGAVALALVVTPMVAGDTSSKNDAYDNLITSSVGGGNVSRSKVIQAFPKSLNNQGSGSNVYTIRRSITQTSNETCIIYDNGLKTDGCE